MKLGNWAKVIRHWIWVAPLVLGLVFMAGGAFMAIEGRAAHNEVRDSIVLEGIVVSGDAEAFAGEPVDSAAKAQAESDVILMHTLAGNGGYLYAEMGRFLLPEGNYMLPNGTYMTADGGTTQDVALAATDENGNPINVTTDVTLAATNASDEPVRAWTSSSALAATDADGNPVPNSLRNTAQTSAFLRTSLGVAVMGFRVSDLVVGLGAFMIVIGVAFVVFMAPAVYYSAAVANHYNELIKKEEKEGAERPVGGAAPQATT
jgi:hypothetical protein